MTSTPGPAGNGLVESVRRTVSRAGLAVATGLALIGLAAGPLGPPALARWLLTIALSLLIALPLANLVAALTEEAKRREWTYVGAVVVVLMLLAWSVFEKVR